ncbi:gamma-2-syntrophin isoform X1 [Xiphophorus couchianus]|uniref:gamma-2-syntrophin isoform X1 n=1 Tax=Xiphophorus couchianus TaxID=32473 RepID=UPI001016C0A5|nr:gamma-2-syntrophin isoform X1 [Xiphophorus couchianus]
MSVTGSRRPASLPVPTPSRSGVALLCSGESGDSFDVCLRLSRDALTIQKLDVVCTDGSEPKANSRSPETTGGRRFRPQHQGRSGAQRARRHFKDLQGPSRRSDGETVRRGRRAEGVFNLRLRTHKWSVRPSTVNGINVEHCTHQEVVHLLRTAGDEVTITVRYLSEVPSFLKLPLGSPGLDQNRVSSPLFNSGFHLNGNNTAPPPSPSANEPKYEKRWLDAVCLPLQMARVSRQRAGSDKLRSNCFELFSPDASSCSVLQFCSAAESSDWLQAIAANIGELTQESIKMLNKSSSSDDQIVHMGWVCEAPENSAPCRSSAFRFLALRGPYFYIFRRPPVGATDWGKPETTYNLYEVLFKVHKLWLAEDCWLQARLFLGLHGSPEQPGGDPLCFSILVGHGQSHTFRVELASDLATWDKSFQRAVFLEVQRVGSKSYMCSSQGSVVSFTLDFGSGFSCSDVTSKAVLWRYKFSQLKGSSDDGKTRVKLLFKNADSNQIEMKELEFANLTAVLHCIHSFIAAKVASLEPGFLCGQSLATHISS